MLEQLPYEFYAQLNLEDMLHLAQVNKEANEVSSNNLFWQPFYYRYVDKNVRNVENPKHEFLLGLNKERQLFVQYLMALSFMFHKVEEKQKSWQMTEQEKKEKLPYYYSKAAKKLYQNYINRDPNYLLDMIQSSGFSSPKIELLQRYLSKIFNDAISGRLQPDTENPNFKTYYDLTPFSYVFETLIKIDAPIAMRMLLCKVKTTEGITMGDVDWLISQSFVYPSPKVLKVFLDYQPGVIEKFVYPVGFYNWIRCNPLMLAVIGARYYGKFKEANEIINFLIEKGADIDFCLESAHPTIEFSTDYKFKNFCNEQKSLLISNTHFTSEQKEAVSKILDKLITLTATQSQTMKP